MLRSGLPENDESADLAATFFEEVVGSEGLDADSAVVYAIPTVDNEPGLRNLERVIENSPVGDALVRSFPESLCGSIPALGDGLEAVDEVFVAVNMGSTNLEASAFRNGEQLSPFVSGESPATRSTGPSQTPSRRRPKDGSPSTAPPPGSTRRNTPTSTPSSRSPT